MSRFKNTSVNLSLYIFLYIYNDINSSLSKSFGPFKFRTQMYEFTHQVRWIDSFRKVSTLISVTERESEQERDAGGM